MNVRVMPSAVCGTAAAPASKSAMIRAVAAALLADGRTTIGNPSRCDDAWAALAVARALGARVAAGRDRVTVTGGLAPTGVPLDCRESGLTARLFPAIAALGTEAVTITGRGSLLRRPVGPVENPLRQLGAECVSTGGHLPLRVRGPLRGGPVEMEGALTSQFLTGLLMALPMAPDDSILTVQRLASRPYIDLTLTVMRAFGVIAEHEEYGEFRIRGNQRYRPGEYIVEGDWSGAAFLLVAGAVAGDVVVTGLDPASTQADHRILEALAAAGAAPEWDAVPGGLTVTERVRIVRAEPRAFEIDLTDAPDLFPPLVALAVHARGRSVLGGADRLAHKESDRATALIRMFTGLGGDVRREGDVLVVVGGRRLTGGTVDAGGDHRMAMAAAVAALGAAGPVTIVGAECVRKSYPDFFADLATLGARLVRPAAQSSQ
ncbi:MAG TPA: 3-phosphoshikimate 1-carboxyvinyltransferase [Acidobacteriota bacterium]|nr:3-phosphoshikimate 1-carboxyvinyltransferase [Acidobacteriota bacterium]HQM62848.1 3-phosphoshikimate 1-carboxyvinyltransferase [Acidobacteriota bacterium]